MRRQSMVLYFKKWIKIQPFSTKIGLNWLCYLVGKSRIIFPFPILIFIYFFKYETIESHARVFLTINILSIGTV